MTKTVISGARRGTRSGVPPGTRLNDLYEIERQIAAGGMGEIYRGHVVETGDPVAIKMIKPEFAEDEAMMTLFRKEASALHLLHHENIVRYYVFSVDRTVNRAYLAMEFVEGAQLADMLREKALTFETAVELGRRVAAGLQAAHDKGIIHRDVSPDNIIVPEGDVRQSKIIDFGIARSTKLGAATVIGDGFAGKYNYVSPEQLGMFGGDVTVRSDIYSLGLLLAECLRGEPIDMGGSIAEVTEKRRAVPDLSGVDPRLHPLLKRMLAPKPEDRPASMNEVIERITALTTKRGKTSTKFLDQPRDGERGLPLGMIGAGVAAVMALGGGGWFLMSGKPAERAETPATRTPSTSIASAPARPEAPSAPPPPSGPRQITANEHARRIAAYIRYHDSSDACLFLAPTRISSGAVQLDAFARDTEAVQAFKSDFLSVNGFAAEVTPFDLSERQCDAVTFLHQLDARADEEVSARPSKATLRAGEAGELRIAGTGERHVAVLAVDAEGAVRNLTRALRKDGNGHSLRLEERETGRGTTRLLLTLASDKPSGLLQATGPQTPEFLNRLADDLRRQNADVIAVPSLIRAP